MRKRFTKPVLVGVLAVIASAVAAGPAFGEQGSNTPKTQIHQPGVTSGYAALPPEVMHRSIGQSRLQDTLTPTERNQLDTAVARSNSKGSFVPGFTDFPNVSRLQSTLTPTERGQRMISSGGDSSWSDAGIGIGIGLAIAGGLVAVSIVSIRRNRATPVPA